MLDRRERAVLHINEAARLAALWNVQAAHARYHHRGRWYASLERFPAALFDDNGYVLFRTEQEYRSAPIRIGKQIHVPGAGISGMPTYVRVNGTSSAGAVINEYATVSDIEGTKTEVRYIKRKRSRDLRDEAFRASEGVCCVCRRDFSKLLNGKGVRVLQVHHRKQLSSYDEPAVTTLADLAVVCANCHMLLHLDPAEACSVEELQATLALEAGERR